MRDTRKTLPGLRAVEKYAVRCGGATQPPDEPLGRPPDQGQPHRRPRRRPAAVAAARRQAGAAGLALEVEVDNLEQLDEALAAGVELVLLDNFSLEDTAEAVRRAAAYAAKVEASGGLTLANARAVAACGVHYLAIGALTHSAPALDIGLDWG